MNGLHAKRFLPRYGLLLLLIFWIPGAANAATAITSFTSDPQTVESGQTVLHTVVLTTDGSFLSGDAFLTLRRDGVTVDGTVLSGFLDEQNITNGRVEDSFSLPPASYSEPGNYVLDLELSGLEDQEIPVATRATTSFTVTTGTTGVAIPVTVSPTSLALVGGAGETPTASFTITSGEPPFRLVSANDEGRGSFSNATPGLNEVVEYGFRIPGGATDQQQFTDTITVFGADGGQATVLATITAAVGGGDIGNEIEDALENIANTDSQRATAATIATVCPSGDAGPQLQEDCNLLVSAALEPDGSDLQAQASQALAALTTDQVTSSIEGAQVRQRGQINNIGSRIVALRGGAVGLSTRGLALNINGQNLPLGELADSLVAGLANASGGGASSDSIVDTGRLGIFINGSVGMADRDGTTNSTGYEVDTLSLTLGADYRFRDNLIGGVALGYTSSDADIDANGGSLDSDGYNLSLYGTYYQDSGLYLDGILTYGSSSYDQRRNIRYSIGPVNVDQTAKADYDGSEWSVSVGGGYQFTRGAWSFGPTARLEYIDTDVDGYSEKMSNPGAAGAGWATRIESQDLQSFTSQIGGEVAYAISTSWGVLLPSAQLEWVHEFEDNAGNVVGYYLEDTSRTTFSLATDDLDQNYFNLTLGLSATFADGRTGYLSVRKLFGYDDLDAYSVNAGFRMEF